MKVFTLTTLAAVSFVMLSAATAHAGPLRHRQKHQAARIHQGVKSGSLTLGEARALRHEQRDINRLRRDALSDGHVDRHEARLMTRAQDRASRHIYRLKHNGVASQ